MEANNLTMEQEDQMATLLRIIAEQSKFSPKPKKLNSLQLVKIPFSIIESSDISFAEAKNLIEKMNRMVGTNGSYIDVLNDTIYKDEKALGIVLGTMVTNVFEVLDDVSLNDEKHFLILWVKDLNKIQGDVEKLFEVDVFKSKIKSRYIGNEIIIGKRRLTIDLNTDKSVFCDLLFKEEEPGTLVGWGEISEKISGFEDKGVKLCKKDFKDIENIKTGLNKDLYDIGVHNQLFSQKKKMMYRNY